MLKNPNARIKLWYSSLDRISLSSSEETLLCQISESTLVTLYRYYNIYSYIQYDAYYITEIKRLIFFYHLSAPFCLAASVHIPHIWHGMARLVLLLGAAATPKRVSSVFCCWINEWVSEWMNELMRPCSNLFLLHGVCRCVLYFGLHLCSLR